MFNIERQSRRFRLLVGGGLDGWNVDRHYCFCFSFSLVAELVG